MLAIMGHAKTVQPGDYTEVLSSQAEGRVIDVFTWLLMAQPDEKVWTTDVDSSARSPTIKQ
jgi:hypothetical protein